MKTYTADELAVILDAHGKWRRGEEGGLRAYLQGADLRGAYLRGAEIPVVPQLHTKILAAIEAGGELDMGAWHKCDTTHCRAGWAVALAGAPGTALEVKVGPAVAGALIHAVSCPWMERSPNFYADTETALADIRECAAREAEE